MKIIFIRHGKSLGNIEKRYIGSTDQQLCDEGISELKNIKYPDCDILISSPMKRCIQTAEIIYPDKTADIYGELRECDFGGFENKNHIELSGDIYYSKWIESGGTIPFPNGETPSGFKKRYTDSFEKIAAGYSDNNTVSFVVHGGVIMAVLEKYALPPKGFYDWHCENGHGYICDYSDGKLNVLEKI